MFAELFSQVAPLFMQEHLQMTIFFGTLSYVLFFLNWIINTDWEAKFNWFSLIAGLSGLLYLHYSNVLLLYQYEVIFFSMWSFLLGYHTLIWKSNYNRVMTMNEKSMSSLKRKKDSIVYRLLIVLPTTKNAAGHWNDPPFKNAIHLLLGFIYGCLLCLHCIPHLCGTSHPLICLNDPSPICCQYNYIMEGFDLHEVSKSFCSAHVNIAFTGSWSTGKTYLINAVLGHNYVTAQSAPAPTTDKFTCITLGSPYSDPIRSDDYERRQHCELISHINDVVYRTCDGKTQPNVLDVADENDEFTGFVLYDMPGYQREYGQDCIYRHFYQQLIDKVDYTYIVWDLSHGKIEDEFADFFHNKARGTNYELIYNRYDDKSVDMGFLNQQFSKISGPGQEMLSEMYTMKVHENATTSGELFYNDILHLRSKIKSVNQTVYDNRKKLMKENLIKHQHRLTGMLSLYKLKLSQRLIEEGLNLHIRPKTRSFSLFR